MTWVRPCQDCGGQGQIGGKWSFFFWYVGGETCPRCKGDGLNHPPYDPEKEARNAKWRQIYRQLYGHPFNPAPPASDENGDEYFLRTGFLPHGVDEDFDDYIARYNRESARRNKLLQKRRATMERRFCRGE